MFHEGSPLQSLESSLRTGDVLLFSRSALGIAQATRSSFHPLRMLIVTWQKIAGRGMHEHVAIVIVRNKYPYILERNWRGEVTVRQERTTHSDTHRERADRATHTDRQEREREREGERRETQWHSHWQTAMGKEKTRCRERRGAELHCRRQPAMEKKKHDAEGEGRHAALTLPGGKGRRKKHSAEGVASTNTNPLLSAHPCLLVCLFSFFFFSPLLVCACLSFFLSSLACCTRVRMRSSFAGWRLHR